MLLREVTLRVDGATLLDGVDLEVGAREHLAVLGPNGSGKTTLLRILSTYRHPTQGSVTILGGRFGRVDLRELRARVGFVSTALDDLLHVRAAALPLVAAARRGDLWPPPGVLDDLGLAAAAQRALARVGAGHLADRRVDTLSQGERQRVRIARALVGEPELLLLDEPFAGLDLGGRESLLADLDAILDEPNGPTTVLVTHHLEELPHGIRSALLLRGGRVVASGAAADVLRDGPVSAAFGLPVRVEQRSGRFTARASLGPDPDYDPK
ncbi:MAG: ATP-binding cassette domain-containing protein [Actinobacteria bacterium]|nr:ATP-binding cassette domain-containing protein [Actinomycetota bacterium]